MLLVSVIQLYSICYGKGYNLHRIYSSFKPFRFTIQLKLAPFLLEMIAVYLPTVCLALTYKLYKDRLSCVEYLPHSTCSKYF